MCEPDIEIDVELYDLTIERLRNERDRLRNEVVSLRGDRECEWEKLEVDLGKNQRWRCTRCGRESNAPVHAYFEPCPGRPR